MLYISVVVLLQYSIAVLCETKEKLVLVNVLFRHGARAPSVNVSNETFHKVFSNGIGEMTDEGITNSVNLGRFLGNRYVSNGFLRTPMKPSEVYFRSMNLNRCLITASSVGSGMFSRPDQTATFVPVYSQEKNETLLHYNRAMCSVEDKRLRSICPDAPSINSFKHWPDFEGFVYECLGLHQNSSVFPDARAFSRAEMLVNEAMNGLQDTPEFLEIKEELFSAYLKVFHFIIGAGEYRNENILRVKGGHLLHTLYENLALSWQCHSNIADCKKKWRNRKFIAYSSQDWLLAVTLESLGVRSAALGNTWPAFNSMIVLELWDIDGEPNVRLFYKRGVNETELINLTPVVPSCLGKENCSLNSFLSVFRHIGASSFEEACRLSSN